MDKNLPYLVLAFYKFHPIEQPAEEVKKHKTFFSEKDITSRIYISEQGINGQMSASREAAYEYMNWMHSRTEFHDLHFKIHEWHEQVFPRQTVKYRKQLVAYDKEVDLSQRGLHVAPKQWKKMLEDLPEKHLIDVRNDYEWEIGHFQGADLPKCKTFREFEDYAEQLKNEKNPETTPIMMYCTGGIRCEIYSSVLKKKGFKNVYQLEGGIINYGLDEGSEHWLGKLFVFDDRLSIPISDEATPTIGSCYHCGSESEVYYNCSNMDCNFLFLCCPECLEVYEGCCKEACKAAVRRRPFQDLHKPFRRKHHYSNL